MSFGTHLILVVCEKFNSLRVNQGTVLLARVTGSSLSPEVCCLGDALDLVGYLKKTLCFQIRSLMSTLSGAYAQATLPSS